MQRRFDELVAKPQAETTTPNVLQELIELTDQIEQRDADRWPRSLSWPACARRRWTT